MKSITLKLGGALGALLVATLALPAYARNPHCAGGIQYVVGGLRDKDKGNTEDYLRQMNKAVQQLEECATEDPKDAEAISYLGWAYAELDSAGPAGHWFQVGIAGLDAAGDKKKVEQWTGNRNSYWVRWLNDGITQMKSAQEAYPDFTKKPDNDADQTLKTEAAKHYDAAEVSLTRASLIRPGDAITMRNLGSLYTFKGEYQKAEKVFEEGLKTAPDDTTLQQGLKAARVNYANELVDEKKYDEAEQFFTDLVKNEPNNADNYLSLADLYFKRGQSVEGDARKAQFKLAGDNYGKAAALRKDDNDLNFNAALAYQNAGDFDSAAKFWDVTLKADPKNIDALSSYGMCLVELKRCDDAAAAVWQAVNLKPDNKNLHRQLGSIYTRCGNNAAATQFLMIYLAMQNGQVATDPAAAAKAAPAGSAAAKLLASDGPPEQVIDWSADQNKYQTWFYWAKKNAHTFQSGAEVAKTDWSGAPPKASAPPTGGKK
ncbi:MAG TPA: tetratricopeptide repeat protein [Dongiaceae bacterium]|nr:tetratricopeptide repeat protein [Dongiaceae bacterium]